MGREDDGGGGMDGWGWTDGWGMDGWGLLVARRLRRGLAGMPNGIAGTRLRGCGSMFLPAPGIDWKPTAQRYACSSWSALLCVPLYLVPCQVQGPPKRRRKVQRGPRPAVNSIPWGRFQLSSRVARSPGIGFKSHPGLAPDSRLLREVHKAPRARQSCLQGSTGVSPSRDTYRGST